MYIKLKLCLYWFEHSLLICKRDIFIFREIGLDNNKQNTHLSCTVNKKNCHIIFDPQIKMFVFLTYFKMYYLMSLENGVMRVTQQASDNKELIVRWRRLLAFLFLEAIASLDLGYERQWVIIKPNYGCKTWCNTYLISIYWIPTLNHSIKTFHFGSLWSKL